MSKPLLYTIRRYRWYLFGRIKIKRQIARNAFHGKLKIIVGAGPTVYEGWISTDIPHFNVLKEEDWQFFFKNHPIDNLLMEHVLEHFTKEQVKHFLSLSHKYLKPNGCLRIAVPDGYHPDPAYLKLISPPSDGHLSIWNIDTLQKILDDNDFHNEFLEYFTKQGIFTGKEFDFDNGFILRSRLKGYKMQGNPVYSSLIVDAYKKESSFD